MASTCGNFGTSQVRKNLIKIKREVDEEKSKASGFQVAKQSKRQYRPRRSILRVAGGTPGKSPL